MPRLNHNSQKRLLKNVSPVRKTKVKRRPHGNAVIDGLEVRNLEKSIALHISPADCKVGKSQKPNACAAALALARQVPGCTEARVHINRVFLKINNKYWLRGKAPAALRSEIVAFDRGGRFEPGEYHVNPISPSEKLERTVRLARQKKRKSPKPYKRPHILLGVRGSANREYTYPGK